MGKLKKVLTTPIPDVFRYLPGGGYLRALFYAVGILGLNYVFARSLWSGEMLGRNIRSGWVEGRESAPILYAIYVLSIGLAAVLVDVYVILRLKGLVRNGR